VLAPVLTFSPIPFTIFVQRQSLIGFGLSYAKREFDVSVKFPTVASIDRFFPVPASNLVDKDESEVQDVAVLDVKPMRKLRVAAAASVPYDTAKKVIVVAPVVGPFAAVSAVTSAKVSSHGQRLSHVLIERR
jgi:hypothetical protein